MPFRDIVGHRTTLRLLARAIDAGTLPPCLIFTGPEGTGKALVARAVAQVVNCASPVRGDAGPAGDGAFAIDACGVCSACSRIGRGIHPDMQLVVPGDTGTIKIDDVREVLRQVGYKPFEARRRVIVFDSADALNREAQNALLKTLEEPPPSSMLILVTPQPGVLLDTVRSRCPMVRFGPLGVSEIAEWLMREEGLAEGQARSVAAMSRGSLAAAREAAGAASGAEGYRAAAQRVLERVADGGDARDRLDATKEITGKGRGSGASERDALSNHLHAVAALLRDLGVLAAGADANAIANVDLAADMRRLAPAFDRDRIVRAFDAVDKALGALERNASPKTVADWLVLQL
jgi:DNA polymerase III subunit delta'